MNAAENVTLPAADFSAAINDALYDTMHPLDPDFNISLLQPLGVVAFVGMGEPEYTVSSIAADPPTPPPCNVPAPMDMPNLSWLMQLPQ